jgi:DNA repair ATPase RecN
MQTNDKLQDIQWVLRRYCVNSIEDVIELRASLKEALETIFDKSEDLSTEEAELLEKEVVPWFNQA